MPADTADDYSAAQAGDAARATPPQGAPVGRGRAPHDSPSATRGEQAESSAVEDKQDNQPHEATPPHHQMIARPHAARLNRKRPWPPP